MKPKIVVIGAGSFFFARPVIWNMVNSPVLRNGTLALVDTNPAVLKTITKLANRAVSETGANVKIQASVNRRDVLPDADFVVLTFSDRNAHFRGIDTEISAKYGVRMCSSDTIGPGGIFRALREIPHVLSMARDTEELAPDAWMINFVNPTSVLGIALMRHSNIRSFAICDGPHEPHSRLRVLKNIGILGRDAETVPPEIEAKLDLRVAGVNHFTWMTVLRYDDVDYLPKWRELTAERAAEETAEHSGTDGHTDSNSTSKSSYNYSYALKLMDIFGAFPDRIGHTKEYVPYFQGYGVTPCDPEPLRLFDAGERQKKMDARWAETERYASGELGMDQFMSEGKSDHATDIIESMWGGLGKTFTVNTPNAGAVTNMADDAYLELRCHLDMGGPSPLPFGPMPLGILAQQRQVLDTHELTVQAAAACDRQLLLRAMLTDPIVNNIEDAEKIMEELLEAERDALPAEWFE
ncbi:MAG: glycoside hydrolase family 4 [Spirochaetia bacterium]